MNRIRIVACFSLIVGFMLMLLPVDSSAKGEVVYVVPIEETVEKGLYAFLKRAVESAENENAEVIIFEINTPGGAVDAAVDIGRLLTSTKTKTVAFINNRALSAGSYISLNMDEIYMVKGGTMGAAAIIDQQGNTAGKKAESYWFAEMKNAAMHADRDPIYALAMADENVDLPEYGAEKGKLLTLTSEQAVEVKYAEGIVNNLDELLELLGYPEADLRTLEVSMAEKIARFITNPFVYSMLLTIGLLGLVLELFSPGFGVFGFTGVSSLLLFFYGHLVAGLTGYETLILFIIGIALILLELLISGGIAGILGFIAMVASFFLAADNAVYMGISLLVAIIVSILISILLIKVFGKKMSLFKKLILTDSTNTESGYIANISRLELIGLVGSTLTVLRPSGTIVIEDERLDAVSEGGFIGKGSKVKVVSSEGARIIVREIPNMDKEHSC
ncbi:nodulation protein NfeD [Bacillus sp. EB106-08-02-XG196]|uniref:NfeD family protein n=1 Tax=Bacillus sp. EB106-08-02-XG196 TaxID=2737049 RepID=UPI0015C438CD|nr:nodulation protein NfeD [Bacillus sp. EB106-08-02-XG196]NWQ44623.1 nodulation protein NfeD [Bacillus sp. EB106-08-02-XG196]